MIVALIWLLNVASDLSADDTLADTTRKYQISVRGPLVELETTCIDPCQIDRHDVVGQSGGQVTRSGKSKNTGSGTERRGDREHFEDGIKCKGDCNNSDAVMEIKFQAKRTLREGIEVTIKDGRAHFIFYSVVEAEDGPATRRQHSEFRIDRPIIEVELHGHDVIVRTETE
jgi:hypothetical protein